MHSMHGRTLTTSKSSLRRLRPVAPCSATTAVYTSTPCSTHRPAVPTKLFTPSIGPVLIACFAKRRGFQTAPCLQRVRQGACSQRETTDRDIRSGEMPT